MKREGQKANILFIMINSILNKLYIHMWLAFRQPHTAWSLSQKVTEHDSSRFVTVCNLSLESFFCIIQPEQRSSRQAEPQSKQESRRRDVQHDAATTRQFHCCQDTLLWIHTQITDHPKIIQQCTTSWRQSHWYWYSSAVCVASNFFAPTHLDGPMRRWPPCHGPAALCLGWCGQAAADS